MKYKSIYKMVLTAVITIATGLSCVNYPKLQSSFIAAILNPKITPTEDFKAVQEKTPSSSPTDLFPSVDPIVQVWQMIGRVNIDRASNDLKLITGEEPICIDNACYTIHSRKTGSEGLSWAKKYVYRELVSLGYVVELQDWSGSGYTDQNIIAKKPGVLHSEEEIYFVAHLDGVASFLEKRPAADDNGSGAVDILELARVISGYSFDRTIVLLISTGEEESQLGVMSYLSQLSPSELSSIKYVVNIDMIGYDANQDHVMELWHAGHQPSINLVHTMSEIIQTYQLNLAPRFVVGCG